MYGKAKVGRPDWYMMGACIVFALTFSLRSVPLAVLLLLFMPFSLLSLTGELPLPTRNAPICQTLLCISIPLLVIGAFSSLLLLLPRLLIPSACVWLFGGALMLFLPPGAFRKSRMAMYWAVICFAAVVALLMMLLQRYQAYGDLYEGLSYGHPACHDERADSPAGAVFRVCVRAGGAGCKTHGGAGKSRGADGRKRAAVAFRGCTAAAGMEPARND